MANRSGAKGSLFESSTLKYLRSLGLDAERLARAGSLDEGDLSVRLPSGTWVMELKALKAFDIPTALREAEIEASNYAKARGQKNSPKFVAVLKAPGKPIAKSYVVQHLDKWLECQ